MDDEIKAGNFNTEQLVEVNILVKWIKVMLNRIEVLTENLLTRAGLEHELEALHLHYTDILEMDSLSSSLISVSNTIIMLQM